MKDYTVNEARKIIAKYLKCSPDELNCANHQCLDCAFSENPYNDCFHSFLSNDFLQKLECKVDWSEVKVDTKVLVSHNEQEWIPRYFARYGDGFIYTFEYGATSFSNLSNDFTRWRYAKLYEEEE